MACLGILFISLAVVLLGDVISVALDLPVPGAVLGLLVVTVWFVARGAPDPAAARLFDAVIPHAPILFVLAGAGVIANLDTIAGGLVAILLVITLGTAVAMVATGLVLQGLLRLFARTRPT